MTPATGGTPWVVPPRSTGEGHHHVGPQRGAEVRALLGVGSTSEAVDQALDQVILAARLRADVDAYRRMPPTAAEAALGSFSDPAALEDDTDWSALYPEEEP